jgi:hypothetical protein
MTDSAETFAFWTIEKHTVSIQAFDSGGAPLSSPSPSLAWRNNPMHPWNDARWVRCLGTLTGMPMIPPTSRNNPTLVSSRVTLTNGTVVAIPPFTDRGRNVEWKVTKADGTDMISATTDAMVWQREYVPTVASYKITLQPTSGTALVINVTPTNQSMVAVVTHAMAGSLTTPDLLTDTRAFALLLAGGNAGMHPTPAAHRNAPEPGQFMSGSDGHCECACN